MNEYEKTREKFYDILLNKSQPVDISEKVIITEDEFWEMSNLKSDETGVQDVIIWVSQKRGSHGPRIKFQIKNKDFSMTIEDNPRIIGQGLIKSKQADAIKSWVILNRQILEDYWYNKIDTTHMIMGLKKIGK